MSDSSTYQDVLDLIKNQKNPEFLQVVTMQNHMPYSNYYEAEDVLQSSVTDDTPDDEHSAINVFSTGLKYTDQATLDFLSQLNQINKPITVIFYGDHLPGIYLKEEQNPDGSFLLHEPIISFGQTMRHHLQMLSLTTLKQLFLHLIISCHPQLSI